MGVHFVLKAQNTSYKKNDTGEQKNCEMQLSTQRKLNKVQIQWETAKNKYLTTALK